TGRGAGARGLEPKEFEGPMNAHGPSTTNIDPPDYVRSLELADARGQNEKLRQALAEAREYITALRAEVDKLTAPPATYAIYLSTNDDGTVNVLTQVRSEERRDGETVDICVISM